MNICDFCSCKEDESFTKNIFAGLPSEAEGNPVIVKFKNGEMNCRHVAEKWSWGKFEGELTISSYKVINPSNHPQ